jgi:hypothetical protein
MKNIDEQTHLTAELAKSLIREMEAMGTRWNTAFLRAQFEDGVDTYNGSFVLDDGVHLFDVLKHKPFFAFVREIAPRLRAASANGDAQFRVALLVVDSGFDYEVKYDYADADRWAISKLNGGTGMPVGYPAFRSMVVVDHEPSGWFLVRDGDRLLFDVNCSHGAVSHDFLMELNASEGEGYAARGHQFLSDLAEKVQSSAPGAPGAASPYRDRLLGGSDRSKVDEAAIAWLKGRDRAP